MKTIVEQLEKDRREQSRNKTLEKETNKNRDRLKKYTERTINPKVRKIGRVPIPISKLPEKKVKKIVIETPQEELDKREFLEDED